MSHIVTVKTEVRDHTAVAAACRRLALPEPVQGTAQLYSGQASGLLVHLPDWLYPVVIDTASGTIRYDNYGGSSNLRQTALNAGYNEGIKEGRKDRNGNGRADFRNNSAYQKATTDYSSKLGDRNLYQRYYREGYENGYYDGLNGN